MDVLYPFNIYGSVDTLRRRKEEGAPGLRCVMNRKRLWLALALGLALVLLCACSALAEGVKDSLKFDMEIDTQKFSEPRTIEVSITVTNAGDSELPGPVTLYYPNQEKVEEFGSPVLAAGSSKNWHGNWMVTQKELEAGKITFIVTYTDYEDGELKAFPLGVTKRIQYAGAEPKLAITRSIVPQVAQEGQDISVIYEITNAGPADVTSVTIKEDASISKNQGVIESIAAGETGKYVFSTKMAKKDLTSAATVSYKSGGKTYTKKVEEATVKYGKVSLSASLTADKKGGAPGDTVKLTLKLKNSGDSDLAGVTVTDEKLGTVFSDVSVPKGETVTLEKDLTITETQELLFTVTAVDGNGLSVETATGQVKVVATDPTQQIVLKVEAAADRDHVYIIPGGVVRFTITVHNESAVDVSSISIRAVDQRLYTFASIPAGESRSFTRDMEISMAGSFQFTADVKDQLGQTVSFASNIVPIAYAAPTPVPTEPPEVTPEPTKQIVPEPSETMPPVTAEPEWVEKAESLTDTLKYVFLGIAVVLGTLLLIGAFRRMSTNSQSRKAMDHLEGGGYRDYSAAPKGKKRSEIVSGLDEKGSGSTGGTPEESTAQSSQLMAETLQRLYEKKEPAAEEMNAVVEDVTEMVQEKAADVAETAGEAAGEAVAGVEEKADTVVQSANEAAHRRRSRRG